MMIHSRGLHPLIVVGAGGHGRVVADLAERAGFTVQGFLEDEANLTASIERSIGTDEYLSTMSQQSSSVAMGLGSQSLWERRRQLCQLIERRTLTAPVLVDPTATCIPRDTLGLGSQVMMGARVQSDAVIGHWCIVNTGAIVEHGCYLDSYVHVGPGAIICGGVNVGENAFVGAGSVVKEGLTIGSNATVAAGAVVVRDVPDYAVVMGVPAR